MADTKTQQSQAAENAGRRKLVVGEVVSNRMQKTIVVEVVRKKAHPFYGRVVSLSKLKRWRLKDIVRRTALVPETIVTDIQ